MRRSEPAGLDRPVLFCLHYLGGSAREWAQVASLLPALRCVALDLPGFGEAVRTPGYTVAEMASFVARAVRAEAPRRWLLAGHSMGAKVAAVVARRAEDGEAGLAGLEGVVLLAGSPPGPEPMPPEQRTKMLGWFSGDKAADRTEAREYIASNSGADLSSSTADAAEDDALGADPAAWRAWLERGSREDWAAQVGVLQTPALVVAGELDENLGPSAQRAAMLPHFANVRSAALANTKHLLPLERPLEVARLIAEHLVSIDRQRERASANGESYRALIASERVSENTRQALSERGEPDDPDYRPVALTQEALTTLRAALHRILPQLRPRIDLAARIDRMLQTGLGDGWRFAALPPDTAAYRAGLFTLNEEAQASFACTFDTLDGLRQDELLKRMGDGSLGGAGVDDAVRPVRLSATQMRAWFEDLRADAVKLYVAHPQTLARIGYSGIAYGGDGERKSGFTLIGAGQREAWEPEALPPAAL